MKGKVAGAGGAQKGKWQIALQSTKENIEQTIEFGQELAPGTSGQFSKSAGEARLRGLEEGVSGWMVEKSDNEILLPAEPWKVGFGKG